MKDGDTPLARILSSRGSSQRWLVERLNEAGVEMGTDRMHRLCAGKSPMELTESVAIARVLGVEVEDLLPIAAGGGGGNGEG